MRRKYHWTRDELGRFAITREQPAEQEIEQSPPSADAGAGRGYAPTPVVDMNQLIREGAFNRDRGGRW